MKKIYTILLMAIAGCLLTSCSEDIYGGENSMGSKVNITLNYKQSTPEEINMTRTEATSSENTLNNLQVFIFDESGKLKGYKWVDTDLKQDGSVGDVTVKTTAGKSYIYGVANATTALYTLSSEKTMIPTTSSEAWNEEDVQDGNKQFTLNELKNIAFTRAAGEFSIGDRQFMMSGVANDGKTIDIDKTGKVSAEGNNTIIKLRRIVAKIKLIVKGGDGVTFTPSGYEIRNIPRTGQLIDDDNINIKPSLFENTPKGVFESIKSESTSEISYLADNIYIPENRQNEELSSTNAITSWTDRETDNGNKLTDKEFTVAPANSTYIILKGIFKKTEDNGNRVDGDVKYFIHLGDFKTELSDFNVDRNCYYTYTITVNGVNSISVDVDKDTDGSGEGLVLENNGERISYLDSHYGQVNMAFSKSDISYDTRTNEKFIYFMAEDYRGKTGICKLTQDSNGNFTLTQGSEEVDVEEPTCLGWVEFLEGSDQNYPSSSVKLSKEGTSYFRGLVALLKYLMNSYSSWKESETKTYTCFVDENYYENATWDKYVNRDSRFVYICKELLTSTDHRNIRGTVIYGISQYSIQTIYNTDYANNIVAYGCETIRSNDSKYSIQNEDKEKITDFTQGSGSSSWDGLANMKADRYYSEKNYYGYGQTNNYMYTWTKSSGSTQINNKTYYYKTLDYSKAKLACMSRNRDLDGDGIIDDDEVRWYCPTIEQYAGLWIGEEGIPDVNARLVSGNTSSLQSSNWDSRPDPAVHYYANYGSNRFYWAEEGLAIGSIEYSTVTPHGVRCIRNLQSNGNGTTDSSGKNVSAQKFYELESGNTINLKYLNTDAVRTLYQDGELDQHYERGTTSYLNAPAKKFAYASSNTDAEQVSTTLTATSTACSKLTEDNYKWRAPNQRELSLLYLVANSKLAENSDNTGFFNSSFVGCRTQMSIEKETRSWMAGYDSSSKAYYINGSSGTDTPPLRCVRDVK